MNGIWLLQASVGAFFAISGYHKLVNKDRHASLVAELKADHIPVVAFNQWWVPSVEFFGGMAVAAGFYAQYAAYLLLVICSVAVCVSGLKRIADYKPIDKADWLDDLLYLPEVLLAIMLVVIILN